MIQYLIDKGFAPQITIGLVQGEQDQYGHEAIEVLINEMENHRDKLVVILAGYTNEMNKLLTANQGLSSRFPMQNRVEFRDYTDKEFVEIYKRMARHRGLDIKGVTDVELEDMIRKAKAETTDFGNARGVRNLVEHAEQNRNVRLMRNEAFRSASDEELRTITRADILGEEQEIKLQEIQPQRIYLNVPFSEKDQAKALGAKWDGGEKKWYCPAGVDSTPFLRWM